MRFPLVLLCAALARAKGGREDWLAQRHVSLEDLERGFDGVCHLDHHGEYVNERPYRTALRRPELIRRLAFPGPIFQFGVYRGQTLKAIKEQLAVDHGHPAAFGPTFGFDSFRGMIAESPDRPTVFKAGQYADASPASTKAAAAAAAGNATLIEGLFSETLTPALAARLRAEAGQAAYVDVDTGHHASTTAALNWVLQHELVMAGTVIGFPDYWTTVCDHPDGDLQFGVEGHGQALAIAEAAIEHNVCFECICGPCAALNGSFTVPSGRTHLIIRALNHGARRPTRTPARPPHGCRAASL